MRRPALLAAALAAFAACARPRPSVVRIAHESDAITLDPAAVSEAATHSILSNVLEGLVLFDRDMALTPGLAVSWGSVDGHTWVVELRRHVAFHDGTPLTAAVVQRVLARLREAPSATVRSKLSTLAKVEAIDDAHLRLTTVRPDPLLMNRLGYVLIGWTAPGPDGQPRPVGTGPYRYVRWEKGRALEVERNPAYWGARPAFARAEFVPVEEGPRSIEALRGGAVDAIRFLPEPLVGELTGVKGVRVLSRVGLGTYYLWLNAADGKNPMADARVRRAISMAIDRREVVRRLGGFGVPANQLVQQGIFGYVADLPELPYDPEGARRLLAEAGYAGGFSAALVHRAGASMDGVADTVVRMLGAVGLRVTPEVLAWPELVARWQAGRLPFFLSGWTFDNGDALSFYTECLASRNAEKGTGLFNPGFSSPRLDRMIDEQSERIEDSARREHYASLMRTALEEMPLVPLFTRTYLFGLSDRVRWQPRLDGRMLASEMAPAR